ncbi:hypothetical protein J6524_02115 [Bradyrhizobium sp. WSM 1738]|uniref:hypothetical protein n=1 Tax=Bradyrhizobium hereditatis TaxID=2821405 RepID=UPI001CE315A0|nr:hypothetical protein [Bradyrhizobium hereditatis]MCA6113728.1 hypothetical protein [Bradyrhizobium hereditatis]
MAITADIFPNGWDRADYSTAIRITRSAHFGPRSLVTLARSRRPGAPPSYFPEQLVGSLLAKPASSSVLSECTSIFAIGTPVRVFHRLRFEAAGHRKTATRFPIRAPFAPANRGGARINEKMMAKTEKEERLARDRAEISARVASFRETQQKFEREREEYCETTLANAVKSGRPSFWR